MKESQDIDLPYIPGTEFSGEVLEVCQDSSTNFKPGDEVAVIFGILYFDEKFRLYLSDRKQSFLDEIKVGGGLSQQCVVSEDICIPLKNRINPQDAVSIIRSYGNAHNALSRLSKLKENDKVIVIAGSGGDGLAAIEIAAKIHKAKVFVIFDSYDVKSLARDESAYRAVNAQVGLTKVYKFLKSCFKNDKAALVYDTTGSSLIHVASDL